MGLITRSGHTGQPSGRLPSGEGDPLGATVYVTRPFTDLYLSTLQFHPAASSKFLSCAEKSEAPKDPSLLES